MHWKIFSLTILAIFTVDLAYEAHAGMTGKELTPANGIVYEVSRALYAPTDTGEDTP